MIIYILIIGVLLALIFTSIVFLCLVMLDSKFDSDDDL